MGMKAKKYRGFPSHITRTRSVFDTIDTRATPAKPMLCKRRPKAGRIMVRNEAGKLVTFKKRAPIYWYYRPYWDVSLTTRVKLIWLHTDVFEIETME